MLKKTITYTDYEGQERKEDFFFNLSKQELIMMQATAEGGLDKKINKIVNSQNTAELITLFQDLILKSYGEKSDDGKRFIKNKELTEAFQQSEAYSELFMELVSDPDKASEFIMGIVPKDIQSQMPTTIPEK